MYPDPLRGSILPTLRYQGLISPPNKKSYMKPCPMKIYWCACQCYKNLSTYSTATENYSKWLNNLFHPNAQTVQSKTRLQSKPSLWFRMSCGRITAAKFKSTAHTDLSPSLRLIRSICHPELTKFKTVVICKLMLWRWCLHLYFL